MRLLIFIYIIISLTSNPLKANSKKDPSSYNDLVALFFKWRDFENPPLMNGAPDYTKKRFDSAKNEFNSLQKRLEEIDTTGWPIYYQVDWQVVRAEMNGYDFNQRVLRP